MMPQKYLTEADKKTAHMESKRRHYEKNRQKIIERVAGWQKLNIEKTREHKRKSREKHRESYRQKVNAQRAADPQKRREAEARRRDENPEKFAALNTARIARFKANNPGRIEQIKQKSAAMIRSKDPEKSRLKDRLASRKASYRKAFVKLALVAEKLESALKVPR
jgi:hypothetical protein